MQIKPDLNKFIDLSQKARRVPISGEKYAPNLNPALLYKSLFGNEKDSFLFESGKGPTATTRYSFMGKSNSRVVQIKFDQALVSNNGSQNPLGKNPLSVFELLEFTAPSIDYIPHFWGGWVGYIGYEIAGYLENFQLDSTNDLDLPDLYFMQVDQLIVYDHKTETLKFIISTETQNDCEEYFRSATEKVQEAWKKISGVLENCQQSNNGHFKGNENGSSKLQSSITRSRYMEIVEKAKAYISEGDIYQANLAQRFETVYDNDPFKLYLQLREVNPSPFSGYLKLKDSIIVSSSPERLIKVEGDRLETRPIAGTRPRGNSTLEDEKLSKELLLNEKEKAEHLMLVDLERNDLGRICDYGSVRVTDLMFLEKYSHVSHIVSNIEGKLVPEVSLIDIIRAVFPGGTITGCPKIRCMEIINELENTRRGPYSGSFGYIGFDRRLDLNIIIRTIILKNQKAYFHVGAGIVADSVPEKEYQETLDKAAALIKALSPDTNS